MKNKIIINYIMGLKNKISSFLGKLKSKIPKSITNISTNSGILHNKIVLYAVFIFSLLNLFLWSNTGDFTYITVFILIGFITSFFSKNMVVILLLSLILTNILKYGSGLKEGFEEGAEGDDEEKEGMEDEEKEGMEDEEKEGMDEDEKEGMDEEEKEGMDEEDKEGLQDLKKNAKELLTTISGLNEKIKEFSKFDFTK
jgi:hypothetical protein